QPGAGADRALDEPRQVRKQGLRAAEAPRREGRGSPPGEARRQADEADRRPGRLSRRLRGGAVQAGALPLLIEILPALLAFALLAVTAAGTAVLLSFRRRAAK